MTDIPEKLTPVPQFDRSVLPSWIADVGTIAPDMEHPGGVFVMTASGPHGEFFHCDVALDGVRFDDSFWGRFAEPMVNSLGGILFEAEWPDLFGQSVTWEAEAAIGRRELNELERKVIARRDELTWKAPVLTA